MNCRTKRGECISHCVKFGILGLIGIAALTAIVMQLWNCVLPDVFNGVARIGYWQALGLLVLSRILFGGWRGGCHARWRERRAHWESLSDEERQQLKGRLHGRWGFCGGSSKTNDSAVTQGDNSPTDRP